MTWATRVRRMSSGSWWGDGVDVGVDGSRGAGSRARARGPRRAASSAGFMSVGVERAGDLQGDDPRGPELGRRRLDLARAGCRPRRRCCPARGGSPSRAGRPGDPPAKLVDVRLRRARARWSCRWRVATAAACIAWPRRRTIRRPVSKSSGPGEDQRRVLAQAQPGGPCAGGHDLGLARLQALRGPPGSRRRSPAGSRRSPRAPRPDPRSRAGAGRTRAPRRRGRRGPGPRAARDRARGPCPRTGPLAGEQEGDPGHRRVSSAVVGCSGAYARPASCDSPGRAPAGRELLDDPGVEAVVGHRAGDPRARS